MKCITREEDLLLYEEKVQDKKTRKAELTSFWSTQLSGLRQDRMKDKLQKYFLLRL